MVRTCAEGQEARGGRGRCNAGATEGLPARAPATRAPTLPRRLDRPPRNPTILLSRAGNQVSTQALVSLSRTRPEGPSDAASHPTRGANRLRRPVRSPRRPSVLSRRCLGLGISVTSLTVLPSTDRLTEPQQMVQRRCFNALSGDTSGQVKPADPRPAGETLDFLSEHAGRTLSTFSDEHVRRHRRPDLGRGQPRKVQNRNKVKIQQA